MDSTKTSSLLRLHNGVLVDNAMDTVLHACGVMGTLLILPAFLVVSSAVVTGTDLARTNATTVEVN